MTNRENIAALGLHLFEHNDAGTGNVIGFTVQPCTRKAGAPACLRVNVEQGESEEDALGRLHADASAALE